MKPQLKEIDGRYYQEVEVVILATKNDSNIYLKPQDSKLVMVIEPRAKQYAKSLNFPKQHLYIVSNETIKESDWYIWLDNSQICRAETDIMIINQHLKNGHIKKIIATTNEYIGYTDIRVSPVKNFCIYPQPSDSFIKKYIEEYNKGNIITNVLVEYRKATYEDWIKTAEPVKDSVKVDSNNCITIKKIEPKLYTREQVEILITNAFKAGYKRSHSGYPHTDNWSKPKVEEFLKENL